MQATRLRRILGGETANMPSKHTMAAAGTALETMTALRQVTEVRALDTAIDAVIAEARTILECNACRIGRAAGALRLK